MPYCPTQPAIRDTPLGICCQPGEVGTPKSGQLITRVTIGLGVLLAIGAVLPWLDSFPLPSQPQVTTYGWNKGGLFIIILGIIAVVGGFRLPRSRTAWSVNCVWAFAVALCWSARVAVSYQRGHSIRFGLWLCILSSAIGCVVSVINFVVTRPKRTSAVAESVSS